MIGFSADSPWNRTAPSIAEARAKVPAAGITIDRLSVVCPVCIAPMAPGDLVAQCERQTHDGPGAFATGAHRAGQFIAALRRKLILKISGLMPPARVASR